MNPPRFVFYSFLIISCCSLGAANTLVAVKLKQGGSIQAALKGYKANGSIVLISKNNQEIHIKSGSWTGIQVIATPQEAKETNIFERNQNQLAAAEKAKKEQGKVEKPKVKIIPQWRKDLDLKLGGRFNGRKGRTDNEDIAFIADIDYKTKQGTRTEFDLRANFRQRDRETTRRSYDVAMAYEKSYLSTPFGWFSNIDYETYDFQSLEKQELYELGLLVNLLDRESIQKKSLSLRAGGLSKRVKYLSSATGTESDKGYSTGYKYYYNIKKRIKIESKASFEVFEGQEELDRLFSEHSIEFPLSFFDKLSLKLGLEYNYILEPELGEKHVDLRYYNNILWRF